MSRLRSQVRKLIIPALQRRIDFHVTSYRGSHDEAEKAWITIDGRRVLTCSWYRHQWCGWSRDSKGRLIWDRPSLVPANQEEAEVFLPQHLGHSLRTYLDIPIQDALASADPFIRALNIVDRRIGRRTLQSIAIGDDEPVFVKEFYLLRLTAEQSSLPRE